MTADYEIAVARWPEDTEEARALLTNYGQYLAASPVGAAGMCLAGYQAELRALPGKYAEKQADLLLARVAGERAGCAAIAQRVLKDGMRRRDEKAVDRTALSRARPGPSAGRPRHRVG